LHEIVGESLKSAKDQEAFKKLPEMVKPRHRWILEKFQNLPSKIRRNELPESLDVTLSSLFDLIRRQRNDLGHPQESPPDMDRETAFVSFRLFPTYRGC
jgi:hypothetical protein